MPLARPAGRKPGLAPSKQPPAGGRTRNYRGRPSLEQLHPQHPCRTRSARCDGGTRGPMPTAMESERVLSWTGQKARLVGSVRPVGEFARPRPQASLGDFAPLAPPKEPRRAMDLADPRTGCAPAPHEAMRAACRTARTPLTRRGSVLDAGPACACLHREAVVCRTLGPARPGMAHRPHRPCVARRSRTECDGVHPVPSPVPSLALPRHPPRSSAPRCSLTACRCGRVFLPSRSSRSSASRSSANAVPCRPSVSRACAS